MDMSGMDAENTIGVLMEAVQQHTEFVKMVEKIEGYASLGEDVPEKTAVRFCKVFLQHMSNGKKIEAMKNSLMEDNPELHGGN